MSEILKFEEASLEDGSLYNIYTLSFNNIKVPNTSVEIGLHTHRILLLENRAAELVDLFTGLVSLPEQISLSLKRRSLSSHSELKWKLKLDGKWSLINSKDDRLESYISNLEEFTGKIVRSYFFEVELVSLNLKLSGFVVLVILKCLACQK